jgi:hypothetical protein
MSCYSKKSSLDIDVLNKANTEIDLNAQASYQSEVTQLPISLPNVTVNPANKDQYKSDLRF